MFKTVKNAISQKKFTWFLWICIYFLGVYYDYCTRKKHDGTDGYTNYFWCPNPNDVDDQNTFSMDEGDTIGECTEFLYPPGNFYYFKKKLLVLSKSSVFLTLVLCIKKNQNIFFKNKIHIY